MPRYFFHLRRGQMTILDQDGVELAGVAEAVREAVRRGREAARQNAVSAMPLSAARIIVEDEWRTIFEVPLDDVNTGLMED
jgi:hypothetical protein